MLHTDDHVDEAPATVYAKLLDDGDLPGVASRRCTGSCAAHDEVHERRRQGTHPAPGETRAASRPARTRSTAGTSPSCWARRSGPTTTCT